MPPFDRTIRQLSKGRSGLPTGVVLLGATVALVIWSVAAEVPLYSTSLEARVVAFGDSVAIESPIQGRIADVRVAVGDQVEAGEELVVLDGIALESRRAHVEQEIAFLRSLVTDIQAEIDSVEAIAATTRDASQASIKEAQAERRRERSERAQAHRDSRRAALLAEEGLVATAEAERARRLALASGAELDAQTQRVTQAGLRARSSALELTARLSRLRRELHESQAEASRSAMLLSELEHTLELHTIRAAASGHIGELPPLAPGRVIAAGTRLGSLVPRQALRVESTFAPEEGFGWIRSGQSARVRLRGFPSTQYGSLEARVTAVSGEVREGRLRVALELIRPGDFPLDLQHGLPAQAEVEVDRVSPLDLVLRAAGTLLSRDQE
jgi:membrane fusion protein (multidrug efflux system)